MIGLGSDFRLGSHWIRDLGHGLDGFVAAKKCFPPNLGKSFNPLLANLIHAHIIYLINYVICLNNVDNKVVLFYFLFFGV